MAQELNTNVLPQFAPPVAPQLSYEEFLREYDGQHAEWVDHKIIKPMPVTQKHDDIIGFLRAVLRPFVEANNLGTIHGGPYQMKMTLPDGVRGREPDIFFVGSANANRIGKTFFSGAADLAIEIISQESRLRDTEDKFDEYEQAGVREYWIIDPEQQTARFFVLNENGEYVNLSVESDGKFRSRVLPNLELTVEWLWQEPLPGVIEVLKEWKLI